MSEAPGGRPPRSPRPFRDPHSSPPPPPGPGSPALGEEHLRQGRQALLPGHGGPGAALLLVGAVQVLHLRQGGGGVDGGGELLRQLALLLDGLLHRLPAVLQVPQVLEPLLQGPQGGVVHGAVELLAVAGDEGDGVALVQKAHHVLHVLRLLIQLLGNALDNGVHSVSFPYQPGPRCPGRQVAARSPSGSGPPRSPGAAAAPAECSACIPRRNRRDGGAPGPAGAPACQIPG